MLDRPTEEVSVEWQPARKPAGNVADRSTLPAQKTGDGVETKRDKAAFPYLCRLRIAQVSSGNTS